MGELFHHGLRSLPRDAGKGGRTWHLRGRAGTEGTLSLQVRDLVGVSRASSWRSGLSPPAQITPFPGSLYGTRPPAHSVCLDSPV